ncbi:29483_t:CDS:1, partial [Racocetra persica]
QDFSAFIPHLTPNARVRNIEKLLATSFPNNQQPSDAILVVPTLKRHVEDSTKMLDYKNITQFTKNAPEEQQQELWKEVAEKLSEELAKGDRPR